MGLARALHETESQLAALLAGAVMTKEGGQNQHALNSLHIFQVVQQAKRCLMITSRRNVCMPSMQVGSMEQRDHVSSQSCYHRVVTHSLGPQGIHVGVWKPHHGGRHSHHAISLQPDCTMSQSVHAKGSTCMACNQALPLKDCNLQRAK